MNHVYRILWNEATGCFTAVAENACGRGKRSLGKKARAALAAAVVANATGAAWAGPTGGQVSAGQGTISAGGATTTIHQASPRLAINWQSFNVGTGEAVNFVQPGANAVALNRVLGTEGSAILGNLNANGQVFILNPNGVLFGAGAQVSVGGLLASTLSLSDADFMAGRYTLKGAGGSVANHGAIRAADGGYVALVGGQVSNTGTVAARLGHVALAAGNQVTLDFTGDGLLHLAVDEGAVNAQAGNGGVLQADGGHVLMTARTADALAGTVVNNTGIVQARTLENRDGTIRLLGGFNGGTVAVDGTLDASAPHGGNGGFIDTSGAQVKVADTARVTTQAVAGRGKTGTWLIDPADYNISATGGDISGATLSANLATSNVQILSSSGATTAGKGDININDAFSWSANQLTLTAARDINVNAVVTASGSAALVMNTATANGADAAVAEGRVNVALGSTGFTGRVDMATGTTLHINGEPYTIVNSLGAEGVVEAPGQLQGMYYNANARFALGSDIDASATSTWATGFWGMPNYQGRFNGLGHTISNLTINAPTADEVGLFGRLASNSGARIANVGLVGGSITGRNNVGALVGIAFGSSNALISNSYSTAAVQGNTNVGGLVGNLSQGRIANSHAGGAVTGNGTAFQNIGGLVGFASAFSADVALATDSYASGTVSAGGQEARVGGLFGNAGLGTILRSHATGQVHGAPMNAAVGGLVGYVSATRIEASHASGDVRGSNTSSFNGGVGGLVGYMERGTITGSHASGSVAPTGTGSTGHSYIGGLVGVAGVTDTTTITDSYSTGPVSGHIFNGGLVGGSTGGLLSITGSYSSSTVTALNPNGGSGGLVGATSSTGTTLVNDSYASGTVAGNPTYTAGLIAMAQGNTTVSNSYASGAITGGAIRGGLVAYATGGVTLSNNFWNSSGGAMVGNSSTSQNLGATPLTPEQFKDSATFRQAGWHISDTGGSNAVWRIYQDNTAPLLRKLLTPLTLADAADASLVYNAASQSGGTTASAAPGLLGAPATGRNVGFYNGYYSAQLNGLDITGGNLTITPAPLEITGLTTSDRVYDQTVVAALSGTAAIAGLAGDDVALTGTGVGSFVNRHVGEDKPVSVNGYSLTGADARNYALVPPTGLKASITPAALAVTGVAAVGREYDTTTNVRLFGISSVAPFSGDDVGVSDTSTGVGRFADKHVGTAKPVTVTGFTLLGTDAHNYRIVQPTGLTAYVEPAPLAISASALSRTYNAGTSATINASVAPLGTDSVGLAGGVGSFADRHVGSNKPVTVSAFTLTGPDAGNYTIVQPWGLTADITPAQLAVTGVTANSRVYDTTAVAALSGTAAVAGLSGDTVGVTGTGVAAFADKHVGNNKPVTVTGYSLTGADAGNYAVVQPAGLVADITPAPLAVTGIAAHGRVYDTTAYAALSGTAAVAGLGGDTVGVTGTGVGAFTDKHVGNNKPVTVTGYSLTGADAGNYAVVQPAGLMADITPAPLAVTGIAAHGRVYDTTVHAALSGTAAVAGLSGDTVGVTGPGVGAFADKHVGNNKPVTVTGYSLTGAGAGNYAIVQPAGLVASITPAPLAVAGVTANSRVYDTTAVAALSGTAAVAGLSGDTVGLTGTGVGAFADKHVGNNKPVTVTGYSLTGADAGNYAIVQPAGLVASITPASLAVTGVTANSRVYDTTAVAALSGTPAVAGLSGDTVGLTGTGVGAFTDKNVGDNKPVTVTGYSLTGADAGNYAVVQPAGLVADITPAPLAVSGVSAVSRVYDATTAVALAGTAAVAALGGDSVGVAGTGAGSFADRHVGTAKPVTVTDYSLTGADAANYSIVQPTGLTANVTPAPLAVTGITAIDKVYDATTVATLSGTAAVAGLGSDSVGVMGTGTGTFASKHVGNAKPVTVTGYFLIGTDAGNYSIVRPAGVVASITPASVAVTGITAASRVYDTTAVAALSGSAAVAALAGDSLGVAGTGTGSFADRHAGNAKPVTVTGFTLSGPDAANYTLVQPVALTADITPAPLAVSGVSAVNRVYDATTAVALAGTAAVAALGGDSVGVAGTGAGSFADRHVGTAKPVTVTGYSLTGADAGNYSVVQPTGLTANVTPAPLAVTGITATDKVYDTTTAATLAGTAAVAGLGSDSVGVMGTGTGSFANKNVGTAKPVTVTGYSLAGADAGNYSIVQPTGVVASITPASLVVSGISAVDKVYDTTTAATLAGTAVVSPLPGDGVSVTGTGTGAFADRHAGDAKPVTVTGYTLTGTDAANYTVVQPSGLTARITPANLAVTGVTALDRVYDGGLVAELGGTAAVTPLGADTVNVVAGSGAFADRNVGNAKPVTVTGYSLNGADAGNYAVVQPAGVTASITPAPLAVTADDKVKEIGAPDPAFTFSTGPLAGGDTLADALTGALSRAAGEGLGTYAINQGSLAAVAGNYAIAFTPGALRVQETPPPAPPPPRPPVTPPPVSGPVPGPAPVQPLPDAPPAPPPVGQGPDVPAAPAPLPQGPALVALLRAADSAAATARAVSSQATPSQGNNSRRAGQDSPGASLADLPISVTGAGMQMP